MACKESTKTQLHTRPTMSITTPWIFTKTSSICQVGYVVLEVDEQNLPPIATALFSFRGSDGALVAEAGVAAVKLIRQGRIFVDSRIPTGLALANPSESDVIATLEQFVNWQ